MFYTIEGHNFINNYLIIFGFAPNLHCRSCHSCNVEKCEKQQHHSMGNKPTSSRASSDFDKIDDATFKFVNECQKKLPENATNVLVGEKLLPQSEGTRLEYRDVAPPRVGKEGFLLGVVTMKEALADSTSPLSINRKTSATRVSSKVAPKKFFAIYMYCSTHRNSSCYCSSKLLEINQESLKSRIMATKWLNFVFGLILCLIGLPYSLSSCRLSQLSVLGCNYVMMMKLR